MKILPKNIRVSEEIELTTWQNDMAEELFALTEANRTHLRRFLPWVDNVHAPVDSLVHIEKSARERAEGNRFTYAIAYDGKAVGNIALMHIDTTPEIGYWIDAGYAGQGIMSSCAETLTTLAFETLGTDNVIIRARPDNIASNRIAEKLGYRYDGTVVDDRDGEVLSRWIKSRQ